MRADRPIPGNPWPHDMVIHTQQNSHRLLDLLWVREAWALEPDGEDVPPRLDPPVEFEPNVHSLRRDKRELNRAWATLWAAAVVTESQPIDPGFLDRMRTMDADQRAETMLRINPPSWRERYGDEPFDERYERWSAALEDDTDRPLDEEPERRSLAALIRAWQRGLTTVVPIPCAGTFTRTIGAHALLVTSETRRGQAEFSAALDAFDPVI